MFVRATILGLLFIGTASLRAQEFAYAAGSASYRMTVKSTGISETKGVKRELGLDAYERFTVTLTPHAGDTLALAIVLDSATITAPIVGPIDASKAFGMKVTALLSPRGRVYSYTLPDLTGREAFGSAAEELVRFLPVLPRAPRVGLAWSDTTKDPIAHLGIPIARTRITDYTVAADTLIAGERAWRIDRRSTTVLEGSGESMGSPIVFLGTSIGTGTYFLAQSGRYIGAELREEVKSRASLTAMKQDVVGTQTQTTSITVVR